MSALAMTGTLDTRTDIPGFTSSKPIALELTGVFELSIGRGLSVGTGTIDIPLPIVEGNTGDIVLLNTSTAGATVTVTWTPQGGIEATVITLNPGGILILGSDTADLIASLSVTGSGADAQVQFLTLQTD